MKVYPELVALSILCQLFLLEVSAESGDFENGVRRGRGDRGGRSRCPDGRRLSESKVDKIKLRLARIIFDDRIAHVLRIAFHDCVGGCDGCIDPSAPSNAGPMLETLKRLDDLYESKGYERFLSRADFYALAGVFAVEEGVRNANLVRSGTDRLPQPHIPFRYCREDAARCPSAAPRAFPGGHFNHTQVMDFMRDEFGLGPRAATALLGAHTLGGASGASGFLGFWKEDADEAKRFDNRYFSLLADDGLTWNHLDKAPETGADGERWQWEGFRGGQQVSFMLNADVALLLDINPNQNGRSQCDFSSCPAAPTAGFVSEYASDAPAWLGDFGPAFQAMIENGSRGKLIEPKPRRRRPRK